MGFDFNEQGKPSIDEAACTGCGLCVDICPDRVLVLEDGKARVGQGVFLGCIACGHCVAVCPTESVAVEGRGTRADDRIEMPPAAQRATAEQLAALLVSRRSVRKFKDEEIDRATIERIIEMTAVAPLGIPPSDVGVVVFHGRQKVQELSRAACESFERMVRFFNPVMMTLMRPLWGRRGYRTIRDFVKPLLATLVEGRKHGADGFTYDAPAMLLFHYGPMGGPADCHVAAAYAMLAAESLGLGGCMLGTTEAFNHDKALKARFGIPPENKVGLGLVIGRPAVKFHSALQRRLGAVRFA